MGLPDLHAVLAEQPQPGVWRRESEGIGAVSTRLSPSRILRDDNPRPQPGDLQVGNACCFITFSMCFSFTLNQHLSC